MYLFPDPPQNSFGVLFGFPKPRTQSGFPQTNWRTPTPYDTESDHSDWTLGPLRTGGLGAFPEPNLEAPAPSPEPTRLGSFADRCFSGSRGLRGGREVFFFVLFFVLFWKAYLWCSFVSKLRGTPP